MNLSFLIIPQTRIPVFLCFFRYLLVNFSWHCFCGRRWSLRPGLFAEDDLAENVDEESNRYRLTFSFRVGQPASPKVTRVIVIMEDRCEIRREDEPQFAKRGMTASASLYFK